jgi:hypothetical protein
MLFVVPYCITTATGLTTYWQSDDNNNNNNNNNNAVVIAVAVWVNSSVVVRLEGLLKPKLCNELIVIGTKVFRLAA